MAANLRSRAEPRASTRVRSWLARGLYASALLLAGCSTRDFKGLSGGSDPASDGGVEPEDARPESEDARPEPEDADSVVDAEAEPLDAGGDSAPDTGASSDASAPEASVGDAAVDGACPQENTPRALVVPKRALELARLQPPATVKTRKLGPTLWLGSTRIWTFSGTSLLTPDMPAPPERPLNYPSSARDGSAKPWARPGPQPEFRLDDLLDMSGKPEPLLTLLPGEQGMDVSFTVTGLVRDPAQTSGALAFVQHSRGFFAPIDSVWTVRIADPTQRAVRSAEPLFKAPDPMFGAAAFRGATYVKLLACKAQAPAVMGGPTTYPCVVARAPVATSSERSAYQVYAQDAAGAWSWTEDFSRATPVLDGYDAGISLSWNEYLNKFLAVHSPFFSNSVVLHTAPTVEGPWGERVEVELTPPLAWANLGAREHGDLAQSCGKRIIVSHWSPIDGTSALPSTGDVVLSAIDLE